MSTKKENLPRLLVERRRCLENFLADPPAHLPPPRPLLQKTLLKKSWKREAKIEILHTTNRRRKLYTKRNALLPLLLLLKCACYTCGRWSATVHCHFGGKIRIFNYSKAFFAKRRNNCNLPISLFDVLHFVKGQDMLARSKIMKTYLPLPR